MAIIHAGLSAVNETTSTRSQSFAVTAGELFSRSS